MAIEEVTKIVHNGKIRSKLIAEGYYITPLGLILEHQDREYSIGEIRIIHNIFHKKEVVIISNQGSVIDGIYYPRINMERLNLLETLKEKRIPYKLRDWNKFKDY